MSEDLDLSRSQKPDCSRWPCSLISQPIWGSPWVATTSSLVSSLKLTAFASENGWLEDKPFLFGMISFKGYVSFREGSIQKKYMTFHETKSSNNFITLAGEKKWHPITSWRNGVNPATHPWDVKSAVDTPSLKLTFSHLKMDGWKTSFL